MHARWNYVVTFGVLFAVAATGCILTLPMHKITYYVSAGGGRRRGSRVGHGPPKMLVGLATLHSAHPIICLYVR